MNQIHSKKYYTLPKAQRVMVFAPHMDDESVGCGGALIMYNQLGSELNIVFLTNGKKDYSNESNSLRQKEATYATSVLGAKSVTCFDLYDNSLELTDDLILRIYNQITAYKPDIIFTPNINDLHKDHIITSTAVTEALRRIGSGLVAYYEIWNPISSPNCYINITSVIGRKIRLINFYQSQLEKYNLTKLVLSLNSYRAALFPLKQFRFVEAFLLQTIN